MSGEIPVPVKIQWDQAERIIEHLRVASGMIGEKSERLAEQVNRDVELLEEALRVAKQADADRIEAVRNAATYKG